MTPKDVGHHYRIGMEMENNAKDTQDGIKIIDWTARGAGLYRFYGSYIQGGFWADARLEYRAAWHVTVQSTNYMGDSDRLSGVIRSLAERM